MPGDRSRITRALEVVLATGRPLADWHREGMPPSIDAARAIKIFLDVDRAELYRRIDARFDAMLASGALEEVRALAARELDPSLPAMKAHGVPWLIRHLRGEIALDEAAEGGKRDTRRYTKRQATWFRNQLPDFKWLAPEDARRRSARHADEQVVEGYDDLDDDERDDGDLKPDAALGVDEVGQRAGGLADDLKLARQRVGAILELVFVGEPGMQAFELRMIPQDVRLLLDLDAAGNALLDDQCLPDRPQHLSTGWWASGPMLPAGQRTVR